jgi:ferric-dicitrate binding protein FerR (iron transport regulator)
VSALTSNERRRVFLASQEVTRVALARLSAPVAASEPRPRRRRRRLSPVVKAAMIAALLGTGWLAYHAVEFHPLTSIEQMLPRV